MQLLQAAYSWRLSADDAARTDTARGPGGSAPAAAGHKQGEAGFQTTTMGLVPGSSGLEVSGFGLSQLLSSQAGTPLAGMQPATGGGAWDAAAAGQLGLGLLVGGGSLLAPHASLAQAQQQLLISSALASGSADGHAAASSLLRLQAAAAAGLHPQPMAAAAAAAAAAAVAAAQRQQQHLDPAAAAAAAAVGAAFGQWGAGANAAAHFDPTRHFAPGSIRASLPQTLTAARQQHPQLSAVDSISGSEPGSPASGAAVKKTRRGCRGGRRKRWFMAQQMAAAAAAGGAIGDFDVLRFLAENGPLDFPGAPCLQDHTRL
jgi:hypothetical protein